MGTLFIYRINRIQTTCVWAGSFGSRDESLFPLPKFLEAALREYIVIPKRFAHKVARLVYPYGDDAAKMIEAYPASYHHACVQEMGIGLALNYEKWTKGWPQFKWEILEEYEPGLSWETIKHEWSLEQLVTQRKKRQAMPRGLDKEAWDMLGVMREKEARKRALRSK